MSAFDENPERRVIPRWRDSRVAVATGEMEPLPTRTPALPARDFGRFFEQKLRDWEGNKSVPYAADLVGASLVLNREDDARSAAEFLLSRSAETPFAAQQMARRALGLWRDRVEEDIDKLSVAPVDVIRRLRSRLREQPRNALMWIDLARNYTMVSEGDKAREAMRKAVILAPVSRFALRSAARLFVHQGDLDAAARVLRGSSATAVDPWLLSAEIAVSTVIGKTSRLMKAARSVVGGGRLPPWHLNELASALGTVELNEGNRRAARKLFTQALVDPSDNSIAQVEWAARRLPSLDVPEQHLLKPRTFEARAWDRYAAGDWRGTLQHAEDWLLDEPFSTRPAMMATFVGSVLVEDYEASIRIARFALRANPDDQVLRNNLVFGLASAGRVEEAMNEAKLVQKSKLLGPTAPIAWTATTGLLGFRLGLVDEGRALYQAAMDRADKLASTKAYAAAFLAREEIIAGTPQAAHAMEVAKGLAASIKSPPLHFLLSRLERLIGR